MKGMNSKAAFRFLTVFSYILICKIEKAGCSMNRTDRLLAIVLELQRYGVRRAEDLAAVFETSVRTIYRDMQALSEAGVPVIGAPGQGYSLMEGYFLPPVSFHPEEAVALILGTDFIRQRFDSEYAKHANTARDKIIAILPASVKSEAARLQSAMKLLAEGESYGSGQEDRTLHLLRQAILEERKVSFHYRNIHRGPDALTETARTVAPYGLAWMNGSWILAAFCELRQEIRHFRLSRMNHVRLTEDRFVKPADFHFTGYRPEDDRNVMVRVRTSRRIASMVLESRNFYFESMEAVPEGALLTFRVRKPEDLLFTVMSWGSEAVVVEPEDLKHQLMEELLQMQKRY